ncbi:MAG: hypothetical protein ACFFD4_25655 [Candidatus Odinarchaeota archaeon]
MKDDGQGFPPNSDHRELVPFDMFTRWYYGSRDLLVEDCEMMYFPAS